MTYIRKLWKNTLTIRLNNNIISSKSNKNIKNVSKMWKVTTLFILKFQNFTLRIRNIKIKFNITIEIRKFSIILKEKESSLILFMDNNLINIMIILKTPIAINISSITLHKNDIVKKIEWLIEENFRIIIRILKVFITTLTIILNNDIVENVTRNSLCKSDSKSNNFYSNLRNKFILNPWLRFNRTMEKLILWLIKLKKVLKDKQLKTVLKIILLYKLKKIDFW